jgi:hypothetical protein
MQWNLGAALLTSLARATYVACMSHLNNNPARFHLQLEEEWIQSNPKWVHELEIMLRTR